MIQQIRFFFLFAGMLSCAQQVVAANTVPSDVQMPGTQPNEISMLESPNKCDNCHGGYNSAVEPAHNWRGSMMSHAGRDPIFWATLAIAEQDFDGVGDLCIRCHSTGGWLAGRSTPTDGSGLVAGDSDGVECDYCHKLTNPDDSEHQGNQFAPFVANDGSQGYFGSGMSSMWGGSDKLGPYNDAEARHQFMQSQFHRDAEFCGTCHDVSNPVVGNLAHNNGVPDDANPVVDDDTLGGPVDGKAAFNNPPYAYGIVERTFSEFKSGKISQTPVEDYASLPGDLQAGALAAVYAAATQGGPPANANYENPPATRYFTCQSCHMRPVTGTGANKKGVPLRDDLPLHDLTGGNYWMPIAIDYLNGLGKLRLGGDMTASQIAALHDGAGRALEQVQLAATLAVEDEPAAGQLEIRVTNHTGHKLISGYPEGRRMWLNIKWFDTPGNLIREDGEYGNLDVLYDGTPLTVRTILDLEDPNTRIYEAHMGMTREWANQLISLGYDPALPLKYDRVSGDPSYTLGDLANQPPDDPPRETFHFALNNIVVSDNRIPPYGMNYAEAKKRNARPVPETQYGCDPACVEYEYYDEVHIDKPVHPDLDRAVISLMYQPTSWEYVQFLALANDGSNPFLAEEGDNMLDAWLHAGAADNLNMAEPVVMAAATWPPAPAPCETPAPHLDDAVAGDKEVAVHWSRQGGDPADFTLYHDQAGKSQWVADTTCASAACSFTHANLTNGQQYCYMLTARAECESDFSNIVCATPQPPGQQQLAGVSGLLTGKYEKSGKGKDATITWVETSAFLQGDRVVIRGLVTDSNGAPISGATFDLHVNGPEIVDLVSGSSDATGHAEAEWATQGPNRKGNGGTTPGAYTATVSGLSAGGLTWDGQPVQVNFTVSSP